ncbi:unnamed protein product [Arabidopsis thaliana]|uniref:Purple acid phosphatase n=1 Tax=Arabidopsis thaliana TaxID=3702 RepID=A0A5S9XI89_ARATH|nr:unnamed protein product [Arabidopsis thaliana]
MGLNHLALVCFTIALLNIFVVSQAGVTSTHVRVSEPSEEMPLETFPPPAGYNAAEQVHITQGDHDGRGMIISWILRLHIWLSSPCYQLEYETKYFYELGTGRSTRQFNFMTPPKVGPDVPYTFGVIGDLGQTFASNQTLYNYMSIPKGQAVLFARDLSYADDHPNHDQRKWDSYGRFVEPSVAYQPWIWAAGNHEIDYAESIGETQPFKPYKNRYHVPYRASQSTSSLWYSIKRASAYIIVLSSYSAYDKYTPQNSWLQDELKKVNRSETPWLIVLVHAP